MTDFILPPGIRLRRRISAALFCLGYGVLSAGMAAAQAINPVTIAPPVRPTPSAGVRVGAPPLEEVLRAPANADKVFITVRSVTVEGTFPELEEQTAALIGEIQSRRVSLAKIYEFARALQGAYFKAGYPLARVTIPPQNLRSGLIRIAVIDGFIEDIDLSAVPERARNLVGARLEPLIGKRHATLAELQRRVLLIGDIAGVTGRSVTRKGSSPGGVILAIEATEKLVSAATVVSNRLPKQIGTWEFVKSAELNNVAGWGEQFYVSARSSTEFDRFFDGAAKFMAYGGGVIAPIGSDGLRLNAGYIAVRQRPTSILGTFPIEEFFAGERLSSRFERAYVQAIYPLILTIGQSLRVQAGYDYTTNVLRQGPAPAGFALPVGFVYDLYRDRYDAIRFAGDWAFQFPWGGRAIAAASYSHGLGGRTAPLLGLDSQLSRLGASPNFNRLYIDARIYQPLPEGFEVSLTTRALTSFGAPLVLAEKLSLDGANALSGFAAGTLNVDRGVTVRSELSRPSRLSQNAVAAPYIFGAWGRGVQEWPFIGELKRIEAESLGGGLRAETALADLPFKESLSVEFAKDFSNIPFRRSGYRTNFTFVVKF